MFGFRSVLLVLLLTPSFDDVAAAAVDVAVKTQVEFEVMHGGIELSVESQPRVSVQLAAATDVDVSGTYRSVVTSRRGKRRTELKLVQQDNEIIGTWDDRPEDRVVGVRTGDRIVFEWYSKRLGYDLVGYWQIKEAGAVLEGIWERPDGASSGAWVLTRIE